LVQSNAHHFAGQSADGEHPLVWHEVPKRLPAPAPSCHQERLRAPPLRRYTRRTAACMRLRLRAS
jgi:hypothetical protein